MRSSVAAACVALLSLWMAAVVPIRALGQEASRKGTESDLEGVIVCRKGLRATLGFVTSRPDVFRSNSSVPSREAKERIWETWGGILDYYVALESLRRAHTEFYLLESEGAKRDSFLVTYSSFLAQYRFALELIEEFEKHAILHTVLNEPVPELGLVEGTYAAFKFRFLNVGRAAEFAALRVVDKAFLEGGTDDVRSAIEEDVAVIWKMGQGTGESLTLKNAFAILRDAGQRAWLPVQETVARWVGDIRVWRPGQSLISQEQIQQVTEVLRPGDILLQRREWYLSNVGLPGFWTHAALYVGTPGERENIFETPKVGAWVRHAGRADGSFEGLLRERYPGAYAASVKLDPNGHRTRVLEAIAEGVVFTTLEHSAAADSLAVLRPKLPPEEKARALLRAFHYSGRPYDYDFDFLTDAALVCSELIYKAYEPSSVSPGITLPLRDVMGRKLTPPNEIARMFDEQFGTPNQQLDLVVFLDGSEQAGRAEKASVDEFRRSWKRPKWHILVKREAGDN